MSGIYIHIPFCRKACTYCNFHFSVNLGKMDELMDCLIVELQAGRDFFIGGPLESLYFGGGTPSIVAAGQIKTLIDSAKSLYTFNPGIEITLEANPDDLTPENLQGWKEAGVNRLSIGVQSLDDYELKMMNRSHNAEEARLSVALAMEYGFKNLSVDLIYGSAWQSNAQWKANMEWAFTCGANHISAYGLTVEPRTVLAKKIRNGIWPEPEESRQAEQYGMLCEAVVQQGWDFYEISNLCKPGNKAIHNSNYWNNKPYLGIGPSAHSYSGNARSWNVSDNARYIEGIQQSKNIKTMEILDAEDRLNEYLLTHLRLNTGVDLRYADELYPGWSTAEKNTLDNFKLKGYLNIENNNILLTNAGRLMADLITSGLMVEKEAKML